MTKIIMTVVGVIALTIVMPNFTLPNISEMEKEDRMLLVLSAPSINNTYYLDYFDEIVNFQIQYAKNVLEHGLDDIRILVDAETKDIFKELPEDVLVVEDMEDIWMRDFTTINPKHPIQFIYTDASMSKKQSKETQEAFSRFADKYAIKRQQTSYILDGGNIVDNYAGKVVTTTRFLEDNNLTYVEGKEVLKDLLRADQVAIIEPDDEVLAHADGMVAWIDDNVLAVNDYTGLDREFDLLVMEELQEAFPDTTIIKVPVVFDEDGGVDTTKGIGSACGVNLNIVATHTSLYVPMFGGAHEKEVIEIIAKNTSKNIVEVDARNICLFGGSVRCTTWQLSGENARKIVEQQ